MYKSKPRAGYTKNYACGFRSRQCLPLLLIISTNVEISFHHSIEIIFMIK